MNQLDLFRGRAPLRRVPGLTVAFRADVPGSSDRLGLATELGAALVAAKGGRCRLIVNANRRRVLSWRTKEDHFELSVHHLVLDAPQQVMAVVLGQDGPAWDHLRNRFRDRATEQPTPTPQLNAQGAVHDLAEMFDRVNAELFDGGFEAPSAMGWGEWPRVRPRRGLRLGSCGGSPPVVRIHPCLDHPTVPDWFVEVVLFHELLHIVHPPRGSATRRLVHPPEFRARERTHPRFEDARRWETDNISALVQRCAQVVARRQR